MPVLLAGRERDDIARADLFDRSTLTLRPPAACRHDQGLTERMSMPRGPRRRFERDAGALYESRIRRLKQRIDPDRACEPFSRTLAGCLRTSSFNFHCVPQFIVSGMLSSRFYKDAEIGRIRERPEIAVAREQGDLVIYAGLCNQRIAETCFSPPGKDCRS